MICQSYRCGTVYRKSETLTRANDVTFTRRTRITSLLAFKRTTGNFRVETGRKTPYKIWPTPHASARSRMYITTGRYFCRGAYRSIRCCFEELRNGWTTPGLTQQHNSLAAAPLIPTTQKKHKDTSDDMGTTFELENVLMVQERPCEQTIFTSRERAKHWDKDNGDTRRETRG